DGQVVGNLNLSPFFHWGRRIYLIANVAVNPNYRRRGIARALTQAALKKSRRWRVHEVWLHVQDDNPAAINLYTSMGFQPRIRRSTWNIAPKSLQGETPPGVRVTTRSRHNWKLQRKWLKQNYPLDLRWHIPLKFQALKPGLWNKLYRFFAEIRVRHWAALSKDRLLGVLTWQATHRHLDRLWLAASPETEEAALQAILPFIQREKYLRRPLSLDYPADRAVGILEMTGFEHQHTLIWMKVKS
ncbi:MAG: GNAT family N-acetyltransferase, partial [Chloroflexota bacterium]|nr:GNAT family N-acetyltransferase [Chloroflexota bacterium]